MQDLKFLGRNPINVNNLHIPSDEEVLRFYITIPDSYSLKMVWHFRFAAEFPSVASVRLMSPT